MHLLVCRQSLYLQVIWAYLSSNLYVLDQQAYRNHLGEALYAVIRLGLVDVVWELLARTTERSSFSICGCRRLVAFACRHVWPELIS